MQIDIDDEAEENLLKQMVEDLGLSVHIKNHRASTFILRNTDQKKQNQLITPIGVTVDVAVGSTMLPVL